jgi:HD superfamily phosphohydrolase YqeK
VPLVSHPMLDVDFPSWAHISDKRRAHVRRVAALCSAWAERMAVSDHERARWLKAVALHDALKSAPHDLLVDLAPFAWGVDKLRHGPAAAVRAEAEGESDRGVLDAVKYHSIGYAGWDQVGRVLYLADFLEPGRQFHRHEHKLLVDRVPNEIELVLRTVAAERIAGVVNVGRPLIVETVEFWNSLVQG